MPEVIRISDSTNLIPTSDYKYGSWDFDEFNPVQSRLMDIYDGDCNIAIAAATSAGKTVCAEMFMAYEIRKRKGKTIYVGPLKALAREKEQDWTDPKHHFHNCKISIITGDFRFTGSRISELEQSDIIVMTPEMLASRCRNNTSDKSKFLSDVGTVVFDESHLLTVPSRGDHIEVALMKLAEINPNIRVVLLSATMPNVDEICGWTSQLTGRDTYFLESDYRPCPLNIHYENYYDGDKSYDDKEIQKTATACAIVEYYPDDKFLIFVHTKRTGNLMVEQLSRYGVSAEFHNADLDYKSREKLEAKFKDKNGLRVVVATSTLAWGLNLPARRVIVAGVHRGLTVVENYDIQQMIGRAGRPRFDPVGDAYILVPESQRDIWVDHLKTKAKIKSTLLDFVGTAENPHYKTLAFHVVSEIHRGTIKTKDGFHTWFRKSLAHYQDHHFDDEVVDKTIDRLVKCWAIKINEDGEYECTAIGTIASMFYYSPFDVSDLRRNFHNLFKAGRENDDIALAMAFGNVDSNKYSIANRNEKEQMHQFDKKQQLLFGENTHQVGAVKYGYAYYNLLKGVRNVPAFQNLQSSLTVDLERTMQVVYSLDSMASKWDKKDFLKMAGMRLRYGVPAEYISLCQVPNIGQVRAKRLMQAKIKTLDDIVTKDADTLAKIMKCSKKLAEEALSEAKQIKIEESL